MTKREAFMAALRRETVPALTWAPNFDHWYWVNLANGTIPDEYWDLSPNDLVRAVGGTIWRRVTIVRERLDPSVRVMTEDAGTVRITRFATPVGEIRTVHRQAPDSSKAWFLTEHRVKGPEDMRVLRYIIDATSYELDTTEYERQRAEVGEDGIVLTCLHAVPFIEFAKMDIGYQQAYYLEADYPELFDDVVQAYHRKFLEAYRLAAQGPCEVVSNGDNMDQLTCPPHYFQRYAAPFYRDVCAILHAGGKLAQGHWCGQLACILPLVPACGLDIIEAVTPKPMSKVDMREAMDLLEGKVTVQGGIPAVYMCPEGCTRDELARYTEDLLTQIGRCRGFILGMGDNVPSSADFARVKLISDIVAAFNWQ